MNNGRLDEEIETNKDFSSWPPSNYPFLIALMLLIATAVTLVIGDEKLAENLAIYVYYFLVLGVIIHFFELALPEDIMQRFNPAKERISDFLSISGFERQHPPIGAHPGKNISLISDISLNVAILLSVFLIISLAYGVTIDMRFVKRYIGNLILIIIVWLTLYIFLRVRFYTGRLK